MVPIASLQDANGRTLKRPFTAVTISTPPSPKRTTVESIVGVPTRGPKYRAEEASVNTTSLGRHSQLPTMSSAAGPRMYENQIPSFMSVYDMDMAMLESPGLGPIPKLSSSTHSAPGSVLRPQPEEDAVHSHQHRESTSTQASDSTDSSPTTTISTVDSSSLSDPSPNSSPESPVNTLVPLSSFPGSSFGLDSFQSLKMDDSNSPRLQLPHERPMTSPSPRKGRNLKSLALNLNPSSETVQALEPSSPSFIKPPALTGRRKPSILSLNTGAANRLALSVNPPGSPGIPIMLQRRGLKHSISSPQISTPSFGPSGGMTLGGERKPAPGPSRFKESSLATEAFTIDEDTHEAPAGTQMATRVPGVAVGGDSFDRHHSGDDAKSPSYPEGPILMHEPSVHLYLEPKAEEAMKFDVIINVAREVKNPFKAAETSLAPQTAEASRTSSISSDCPPDTAISSFSFQTAFEFQPLHSAESTPTTPTPNDDKSLPEYIHVPWDHNTDVKDELWDLCELIDKRTKEGKKVLVHCQQGASRSATLIIAYHMYKNQELSSTEAYSQAQSKSRWVNPNMSLLFSLSDFKKVIEAKKAGSNSTVRKPTVKHRPTLSAYGAGVSSSLQVPSIPCRARGNSTPNVSLDITLTEREENVPQTKPVETMQQPISFCRLGENAVSPAPSFSAIARMESFDFGFGDFGFGSMTINNIPPPEINVDPLESLMSPRLEAMTENPIQGLTRSLHPESEASPIPDLFSPRTMEFNGTSFFPPISRAPLAVGDDPRSPPTKGEALITRSIDDFL